MWSRVKPTVITALLTLVLGVAIGSGVFATSRTVQGQGTATGTTDDESALLREVYTRVNPSVVSIDVRLPATSTNAFPGRGQGAQSPYQYAAGSGFVYDNAGHIVTNAHVVDGADRIEVTFSDDTTMVAKVVGIDPDSDIAVIQVQGDASKYPALQFADSDQLQVGDRAIAIGNPFENAGTMTQGIVSGLHRSVSGLIQNYTIPDVIQTDAAINPGNSGGPLLNSDGQLIGVNEQIASSVRQSSGVSFAIPSNLVKQVADDLIKSGKEQHTWLGIAAGTLSLDLNVALKLPDNTHGAYITAVQPGSPAAKAGLRAGTSTANVQGQETPIGGDIITAVDQHPVRQFEDLTAYLFEKTKVGQTITLTVLRDGKQQDIQVTLGARSSAPAAN